MAPPLQLRPFAAAALVLLLTACGGSEAPQPSADSAAPAPAGSTTGKRASASRGQHPAADEGPCGDQGLGPEPDSRGLSAFVRKRAGQVRDCYQRELKRDSSSGGKATIRFTIERCGELSNVAVVARSGRVDGSAACVTRAMRGWRTPFRPAEPVTAEYPFAFSAGM